MRCAFNLLLLLLSFNLFSQQVEYNYWTIDDKINNTRNYLKVETRTCEVFADDSLRVDSLLKRSSLEVSWFYRSYLLSDSVFDTKDSLIYSRHCYWNTNPESYKVWKKRMNIGDFHVGGPNYNQHQIVLDSSSYGVNRFEYDTKNNLYVKYYVHSYLDTTVIKYFLDDQGRVVMEDHIKEDSVFLRFRCSYVDNKYRKKRKKIFALGIPVPRLLQVK